MTYDLYVAAFAGAGITVLALVSDWAPACASLAALPWWYNNGSCDAQSVGAEASQAPMTDDSCTIALCSLLSADTNIIIMP